MILEVGKLVDFIDDDPDNKSYTINVKALILKIYTDNNGLTPNISINSIDSTKIPTTDTFNITVKFLTKKGLNTITRHNY